eukprot:CAMPEP_0170517032 /NCGR_PEP_ID=MMETSP0209-20121228/3131_1 /TAXON_ID=665100 ORGANISM="Litonotus pictus, Strain P1" /NCGR_SAMPLE_ID=MMETSP0209 /ASSEMBLY_ACC=CAM_ASM_000301 /LENGTH=276 /DNA_ID=CAMNT_0010802167 /DNA_START=154 /DNA_END=984 /DNA_ORIENTATION=+
MEKLGSYTYKARTAIWAVSGPGWSNILAGISTELSGIVNNDWMPPSITRSHSKITPVTGLDPLPTVFAEIKKNNPKAIIKTAESWPFLLFFGDNFIPGSVDEERFCHPSDELSDIYACDERMKNETLKFIKEDFDFIFSYYNSMDDTGHATGFCSEKYIEHIAVVNGYIHEILDELENQGIADETTVIVTTDHGATRGTKNHGGQDDDDLLIPYLVKGPGIKKNHEIEGFVRNYISPEVVLRSLGYPPNYFWEGRVPEDMYEKAEAKGNLRSSIEK